jgi:hypothetical protein
MPLLEEAGPLLRRVVVRVRREARLTHGQAQLMIILRRQRWALRWSAGAFGTCRL